MKTLNKLFLLALPLVAIISITLYEQVGTGEEIRIQEQTGVGSGHFTVTVHDSFGNIVSHRQSDNAVLNGGENCIAKMLFSDPGDAGNVVCAGATDDPWRYFCLDEDPQIILTDTELRDPADEAGLSACALSAVTWNQNSTSTTDALSKVTLRLSHTFTNTGASETIAAVGVFNGSTAATNNMLSKANFTATPVPTSGTLTVQYDYEVGGGTVP